MSRPLRLPPLVRAPLTLVSAALLLAGGVPVAAYPFLAMDASHYRVAIAGAAGECAGNPVPAPGGCWSAATARVTITGVDQGDTGPIAYLVLQTPAGEAVRENVVAGAHVPSIDTGTTVAVRYWGDSIVEVLPPVEKGMPAVILPTRDNPAYRAAHFPTGGLVALLLGVAGIAAFGVPLFFDVRRWRRRRAIDVAAEAAAREAQYTPGFARGLARYGMSLEVERPREATIVGHDAWEDAHVPPPTLAAAQEAATHPDLTTTGEKPPAAREDPLPPNLKPGGAGWNIRTR